MQDRVANVFDRIKGMRPTFRYAFPCDYSLCERPVPLPPNESPAALTAHHSRQLLRLLLAKPSLLSFNIVDEQPLDLLFKSFDPATEGGCDVGASGVTYLNRLLFSGISDKTPLFVELLQRWYNIFFSHRRLINWTRLYEDGCLRLLSAASLSEASAAGGNADKLNNDRLLRMYDRFASEVRKLVFRFGNRILCSVASSGKRAILFFAALFKPELDVLDIRMICLLLYDLVDLLENVCLDSRSFYVDKQFLDTQFAQVRRELAFQRIFVFRRLLERHDGFSEMRDWLYFRDNVLAASEVRYVWRVRARVTAVSPNPYLFRFNYLRRVAAAPSDAEGSELQLSIFTVQELHRSTVVLSLHDLMIRYMLRRYFRSGVTFAGGKVDPYSTADFVIDHDVAHFFIFLVQRTLQRDGNYDYPANALLIYDPELWRKVFAHCAAVAPNTFVAQVHAFIAGYYRGGELRFHDILDYVDWLCVDEPWYQVYSRNSIERLRCIEERRLHTHFTALYDHECLLYYLLVGSSCESQREKLERLHSVDALRDFSSSKVLLA